MSESRATLPESTTTSACTSAVAKRPTKDHLTAQIPRVEPHARQASVEAREQLVPKAGDPPRLFGQLGNAYRRSPTQADDTGYV